MSLVCESLYYLDKQNSIGFPLLIYTTEIETVERAHGADRNILSSL